MRQILQNLRTGATEITEQPCPLAGRGQVLIRSTTTLVSAGTERMLVEFGKASLLEKARRQPDKVRMVLDKISADGLLPTLEAVASKLDQPLALGYCNVGVVLEPGKGVAQFVAGDRVVSNGKHAEIVSVSANLCARIPDSVSDEEAAFAVIGAIGLQGIRLIQPTLGEAVVVTGLGLIGLMTVQLLRAHGCRVLGIDLDPKKLEFARRFGAEVVDLAAGEDPVAAAQAFSRGRGVDAVLITASTQSNEPVHQAALMCRKRGRIVLVGVAGLELNRADFYEKELSFQVSCSYGPGRYDPVYEEQGHDYPVGFVRWTEQRNFEAVLDMMASRQIDVRPLITHRFDFLDAVRAYDVVTAGRELCLGLLLKYEAPRPEGLSRRIDLAAKPPAFQAGQAVIGMIGAGNYASRTLLPALAKSGAHFHTIASGGGVSAAHWGRKFGFAHATTEVDQVLGDERINTVMIATRHDSHADLVCRALAAGKHVFVEKPLGMTLEEIARVEAAQSQSARLLCVGFNRRFAPLVQQAYRHVGSRTGPLAVLITVNAGELPADHWTRNREVGGGRIIGEGCHFIDLARYLVGKPIASVQVVPAVSPSLGRLHDVALLQLAFADGSIASIQYLANGHRRYPKERIELFWDNRTLQLDNFRKLRGWGLASSPTWGTAKQDKGHAALLQAFVAAIGGAAPAPIPLDELLEVGRWSIEAGNQAFGAGAN